MSAGRWRVSAVVALDDRDGSGVQPERASRVPQPPPHPHGLTRGVAREVGRLEARLLWANRNGMDFPPYILKALRESVDLYSERQQRQAA